MPKEIRELGFDVDELYELQDEILANIVRIGGESKEATRVGRMVKNKLEKCRSYVRGQNYLERNGHITVQRG